VQIWLFWCGGQGSRLYPGELTQLIPWAGMTRGGPGRDGMLLTWSGGSWKAARALIPITVCPGPDVGSEGVSCLSRSSWTVVGQYQDVDGRGEAQASCSPVWLSQDVTGSVRSGT
jgi:hypothetical protein